MWLGVCASEQIQETELFGSTQLDHDLTGTGKS